MKTVRTLLLLVIVAAACALGVWWYVSPEASHVTVHKAAIKDITPMVRLCALDIYEDVPVRGQIGDKHIFARAVVNGSVTFDLEKMKTEERGDTLLVTLPPSGSKSMSRPSPALMSSSTHGATVSSGRPRSRPPKRMP